MPAATEIMAFLGATEHLVGITHECDFPSFVASRARVTQSALGDATDPAAIDAAVREQSHAGAALFTLHEKKIAALHPDLLLTQAVCDVCAVREEDVRALAARLHPPPKVVTLGGTNVEGILEDIGAVAAALGVPDEAEELIAGLRVRLKRIHDVLKAERAPRPRVALIEWSDPCYVTGHWGPEQVHRAGGRDVAGTAGAHSVTIPVATLEQADPEIVLFAPCGYSLAAARDEAERFIKHEDWRWLAGRQVWALDANGLVSRPGPRVVEGIEAMARIFNPTLFSAIDPVHAVRVA
ncbi:MAG: ABC transporter substrate-binding protein [Phycisphaerae bacterium]|nr:ABC transporter substrate-binding protein [Gemmatimonadaceae bacterium]